MQFNKISGSTIDCLTSLLFREFENEKFYMAFMRQTESWGNCALINISLNDVVIKDVIATIHNDNNKFTDKNVNGYIDTDLRVYIYKTANTISDFNTTTSNYEKVDELEAYDLRIQYINSNWAVIKGLPVNYSEYINNNSSNKFYLVRNNSTVYSSTPDNTTAIAKINTKSIFDNSVFNEPVLLKAVKDTVEVPAIYNLNLNTNIIGEFLVEGLLMNNINSPSITESIMLSDYAINGVDNIDETTPYFILRKASNEAVIVFDKMYLMKTQDIDGVETIWHTSESDQYLLFKSTNKFAQKFYVKISRMTSNNGLAIYHESLDYIYNTIDSANIISDANPPGLDSTYLKNQQVHDSLFDILGLVKIKKNQINDVLPEDIYSKVSFVRELKDETEKNKYINYGFVYSSSANKRLEEVNITSTEPIIHFGNIKRNPNSTDGSYYNVSRLYLYTNTFVIGDKITIKYYDTSHTNYVPSQNQSINNNGDDLEIVGISYQEDNYYIDLNGSTNLTISFDETSPDVEASSADEASIISASTNTIIKVQYAVCDTYLDATKYNMSNVMVDMKIPKSTTDLYSGVYRQLAIVHQPKYNELGVMTTCTSDKYDKDFYDYTNHKYDIGTAIFVANKTPIYRQYLADKEVFKLIV